MSEIISESVRQFVSANIGSVWQIDLLAHMVKQPGRVWTAAELASALYLNENAVRDGLGQMQACGIACFDKGYAFAPLSGEQAALIGAVISAYASHRVAMRQLIYEKVSR